MDGAAFGRYEAGCVLHQCLRGNLVDEQALEAVVRSGHIGGLGLDVGRAPDQMPSPHIAALPNCRGHAAYRRIDRPCDRLPGSGHARAGQSHSERPDPAGGCQRGALDQAAVGAHGPHRSGGTTMSEARGPVLQAPAHACDSGTILRPSRSDRPWKAGARWATVTAYRAVRQRLGFTRTIVVQPTPMAPTTTAPWTPSRPWVPMRAASRWWTPASPSWSWTSCTAAVSAARASRCSRRHPALGGAGARRWPDRRLRLRTFRYRWMVACCRSAKRSCAAALSRGNRPCGEIPRAGAGGPSRVPVAVAADRKRPMLV